MNHLSVILIAVTLGMLASQADAESLGPLRRYDPFSETTDALIRVQGNPRLGTPFAVRSKVQRIGDSNRWLLGATGGLCVMESDTKSGKVETREFIALAEDWCLSPDGEFLFCKRRESNTEKRFGRVVFECFNFRDGRPLWELENAEGLSAAAISADGKQLITLQALDDKAAEVPSAVIWYDLKTGQKSRQVNLPGLITRFSGTVSDALTESGDLLLVTRRSGNSAKAFSISKGQGVADPVVLETEDEDDAPRVRSGGSHGEWVAFFTNHSVHLYRVSEGKLVHVHDIATPPVNDYSFDNNVRFSPDGHHLLISAQGRTLIFSTDKFSDPDFTREKVSCELGDYTPDGKFFVFFDEGGGWIYETKDWKYVDRLAFEDHPVHCCPITEAGFSSNGELIISNDDRRLLLWSKDGNLLAELTSPREKDNQTCIKMQSPIFLRKSDKIFAGDGWEFISWDVEEILKRVERKPINTPRVVGKAIVSYPDPNRTEPALMNIALGLEGKSLVTAKDGVVQYWTNDGKTVSEPLLVPEFETTIRPRTFQVSGNPPEIVMRNGASMTLIDPERKNDPKVLDKNVRGLDAGNGWFFRVDPNSSERVIERIPLISENSPTEKMKIPSSWPDRSLGQILASKDGTRLFVLRPSEDGGSALSVIDWPSKKVVSNHYFAWQATSYELSGDGSQLLIGSHQRAIYVLDVEKMCATR